MEMCSCLAWPVFYYSIVWCALVRALYACVGQSVSVCAFVCLFVCVVSESLAPLQQNIPGLSPTQIRSLRGEVRCGQAVPDPLAKGTEESVRAQWDATGERGYRHFSGVRR